MAVKKEDKPKLVIARTNTSNQDALQQAKDEIAAAQRPPQYTTEGDVTTRTDISLLQPEATTTYSPEAVTTTGVGLAPSSYKSGDIFFDASWAAFEYEKAGGQKYSLTRWVQAAQNYLNGRDDPLLGDAFRQYSPMTYDYGATATPATTTETPSGTQGAAQTTQGVDKGGLEDFFGFFGGGGQLNLPPGEGTSYGKDRLAEYFANAGFQNFVPQVEAATQDEITQNLYLQAIIYTIAKGENPQWLIDLLEDPDIDLTSDDTLRELWDSMFGEGAWDALQTGGTTGEVTETTLDGWQINTAGDFVSPSGRVLTPFDFGVFAQFPNGGVPFEIFDEEQQFLDDIRKYVTQTGGEEEIRQFLAYYYPNATEDQIRQIMGFIPVEAEDLINNIWPLEGADYVDGLNQGLDFDNFRAAMVKEGRTTETEQLLSVLYPNATENDIRYMFGEVLLLSYDEWIANHNAIVEYDKEHARLPFLSTENTFKIISFFSPDEYTLITDENRNDKKWLDAYDDYVKSYSDDSDLMRSVKTAIGNGLYATADVIDLATHKGWLGDDGLGSLMRDVGTPLIMTKIADTDPDSLTARDIVFGAIENAAPSLALMYMSVMSYYLTAGLAAPVIGEFGAYILGSIGGAAVSTASEAFMESASAFNQYLLAHPGDLDGADKVANDVFNQNVSLLSATNLPEFLITFAPGGKAGANLAQAASRGWVKYIKTGGRIVSVSLTEGGQELVQEIISRSALGQTIELDDSMKLVAILGALQGAAFAFTPTVFNAFTQKVVNNLPNETLQAFEELKAEFEAQGKENPDVAALDELIKDNAHKSNIESAVELAQEETTIEDIEDNLGITEQVVGEETPAQPSKQLWEMTDDELLEVVEVDAKSRVVRYPKGGRIVSTYPKELNYKEGLDIFRQTAKTEGIAIPTIPKPTTTKKSSKLSNTERVAIQNNLEKRKRAVNQKKPLRPPQVGPGSPPIFYFDKGDEVSVDAVKQRLIDYIKANMPMAMRGRMLTDVKNVKTEAQLDRAISKVNDIIAQAHTRRAKNLYENFQKQNNAEGEVENAAPVPQESLDKLIWLWSQAKPTRAVTEQLRSEARSKQSAMLSNIFKTNVGRDAFYKGLASLRGQLPEADFVLDVAGANWTEADAHNVIEKVRNSNLRPFEKINLFKAVEKLMLGNIPTNSELDLIERTFGRELTEVIANKVTLSQKFWREFASVLNIPRAVLASFDNSFILRQAALVAWGNPTEALAAVKDSFRAMFSQKNAEAIQANIESNRYYERAQDASLDLTVFGFKYDLSRGEESFMSGLTDKIPWVKWAERAYVIGLNKIRSDVFYKYCRATEGFATLKQDREVAHAINVLTGRGDLARIKGLAPTLNVFLFSPRLILSRIETPFLLVSKNPVVRKMAIKGLLSWFAVNMVFLGLIKLAGGEIEDDPRSADFGKGKIGNTRLDFWAGFQQYARFIAQVITEQRKQTITGEITDVKRSELLWQFTRGKMSPALGALFDLWEGETYFGEEFAEFTPAEWADQLRQRLMPLFLQDVWEATEDSGLSGTLQALPGFFGISVQTYGGDYYSDYTDKLGLPDINEELPYDTLNEFYTTKNLYSDLARRISSADPEYIVTTPDIVQTIYEVTQIKEEISVIPHTPLYKIDPANLDDYRRQWQEVQRINSDPKLLEEFKRKYGQTPEQAYPDYELGNMSQQEYSLLKQYFAIKDEGDKEDFLDAHPELKIDRYNDWLNSHPEETAKLALFGQVSINDRETYDAVLKLAASLGIPDNALPDTIPPDTIADEWFEWSDLNTTSDSEKSQLYRYQNPDFDDWAIETKGWNPIDLDPRYMDIKIKYAKEYDQYAKIGQTTATNAEKDKLRTAYLEANPQFRVAKYTADGISDGFPDNLLQYYIQYKEITFATNSGNSKQAKAFKASHPDFDAFYCYVTGGTTQEGTGAEELLTRLKKEDPLDKYK